MDRSKLFKAAWTAARRGARSFGGSPRQYFRLTLVYAWEAAKAPKPAAGSWDTGRPVPGLTAEQRDRVAAAFEGGLAVILANAKAVRRVRGRSNAGAWIGR